MAEIYSGTRAELDESVDEILDQIMGKDGGFNSEFTELYAKYLGGRVSDMTEALGRDLSDRSDEIHPVSEIKYEDPDLKYRPKTNPSDKIAERIPENMREAYITAERQAQRPEFTSQGEVRYPSMGVGEAEERVVFDADWELKAKQEAAEREAHRRENMLRGDSAYARSFVAGGRPIGGMSRSVPVNPAYIDPLTDDDFRYFEESYSVSNKKREKSLEETFGRADEENEKKGGLFRRSKKK